MEMAKIEQSITINAPVEKVFSYVGDPMNQLEWLPSMTDVRDITGEGVGQKFGWTYKMMGISFKGETEVVESVANQRRVIKSTGSIQSTWTWTFKSENGKTVVNLEVEYTIPVPVLGKVAEQLVLRQNEREAALSMTNIKERLES
jgi:uncharacterized membrane protein